MIICIQDLLFSLNLNCLNVHKWAGLRRSVQLSLRSNDSYPFINSLTFVLGDNIFYVTKGKSKDYAWFNRTCKDAPPGHTPGNLQFLPSPGHTERDNSPPLSSWSTSYTFFGTSFFLTIAQRDVVEFTERRIMDIEKEEKLNS